MVGDLPGPVGVAGDPFVVSVGGFFPIQRNGAEGGVQSSGKAINLHPALPASSIQWMVRRTDSSRLNQPGSALTAAALYFLRMGVIFALVIADFGLILMLILILMLS